MYLRWWRSTVWLWPYTQETSMSSVNPIVFPLANHHLSLCLLFYSVSSRLNPLIINRKIFCNSTSTIQSQLPYHMAMLQQLLYKNKNRNYTVCAQVKKMKLPASSRRSCVIKPPKSCGNRVIQKASNNSYLRKNLLLLVVCCIRPRKQFLKCS